MLAAPATAAADSAAPMRFEWRREGPAEACRAQCRTWVSASGYITADTPRELETFAKGRDLRGAVLVLDSDGGSVLGTLALGRAIRALEMVTTIGRTVPLASGRPDDPRAVLLPEGSCESMCVFLLLAGTQRYVPPQAKVLVHQIWLGNKRKRALEQTYSADELNVVQRDIGRLARYTAEMGGGADLLETALQIPPWEPLYRLSGEELRKMRLSTLDGLFDRQRPAPVLSSAPAALATVGQQDARQ
jgi:hypothetical protein